MVISGYAPIRDLIGLRKHLILNTHFMFYLQCHIVEDARNYSPVIAAREIDAGTYPVRNE